MIEKYNNYYKVTGNKQTIFNLIQKLTIVDSDYDCTVTRLYTLESETQMTIPRGVGELINLNVDKDHSFENISLKEITKNIESLLPGITLREDQVLAVKKMALCKRGIIQMSTGGGKTECIIAFLELLRQELGFTPNTLILVPTTRLVTDTVSRFNKYGIPATKYSKRRGVIEGIVVTHPTSVNNDISKNSGLLKDLQVIVTDEGHHLKATTWRNILYNAPNIEYSIAVSATAVGQEKLPVTDIHKLEGAELQVVGATGNVLLNIPPSYYIERGILANPVLIRMSNPANEYVRRKSDWHSIRRSVLESPKRITTASSVSAFFAGIGYKSLILVDTKKSAFSILEKLSEFGISDLCRISFGGDVFMKWDTESQQAVEVLKTEEDTLGLFRDGKLKILIGTSHIYEGWDCPELDAVIIYGAGKQLRRVIQGIGRVLRKTKTGKYAYIIDFTDHCNQTLGRHSYNRLEMCRNIIGVPESQIYHNIDFMKFKYLVMNLEGL